MITTLYDQLVLTTKQFKDNLYLENDKQQLSFGQVKARVDKLADMLSANHISRSTRVLYMASKSPDAVLLHLACSKLGAIYSIVDAKADVNKNQSVLDRYVPEIVFIADEVDTSKYNLGAFNVEELNQHGCRYLTSKQANEGKSSCGISTDIGLVFYTSGSTGESKGVALSHSSVLFAAESITEYLALESTDKIYNALPLFFDYGYYQLLLPLFSGCATYIATSFMIPQKNIKEIRESASTVFPLVPSMARLLAKVKGLEALEMVTKITNTGEAIHESEISQLRRYFLNAEIYSMYGLTECKRTTYLPPHEYDRKSGSVGIPIPGTRVEICNELNEVVVAGEVGQVIVSGPHVMNEYLDMPTETAKTLFYDPIDKQVKLATGDFGHQDADGYLYLSGRKDDVYKIDGRKYSCVEQEYLLKEIENINDSCVLVDPNTRAITAFVVENEDGALSDRHIRDMLKRASVLSSHIPSTIIRLAEMPMNQNGKHDKNVLRSKYIEKNVSAQDKTVEPTFSKSPAEV